MSRQFWRSTGWFFLVLYLCILIASRCHAGEWTTEMKAEEAAWQALNVADAVLTRHALVDEAPRYEETGYWKVVTGSHPDTERIVLAAAAFGVLHGAVSQALVSYDAPRWAQRAWQFVSLYSAGVGVRAGFKCL